MIPPYPITLVMLLTVGAGGSSSSESRGGFTGADFGLGLALAVGGDFPEALGKGDTDSSVGKANLFLVSSNSFSNFLLAW